MDAYPYKRKKILAVVDEVDTRGFWLRVGAEGWLTAYITRGMVEAADRDQVQPGSILSLPARRDTTHWRLVHLPPRTKRQHKKARIRARQWLSLIEEF